MQVDVSDGVRRTKTGSLHVESAIRITPFDDAILFITATVSHNVLFESIHKVRKLGRALTELPEAADMKSDWLMYRSLGNLDHRCHGYWSVNVDATRIAFPVASALSYGNGENDIGYVLKSAERFLLFRLVAERIILFRDVEDVPTSFGQSALDTEPEIGMHQTSLTLYALVLQPSPILHPEPTAA